MNDNQNYNQIFDLILPSDDPNYVKIKQATKQGWILCEVGGGQRICPIRIANCAEEGFKVAVK